MSDWRRRNARALLRELQAHGLAMRVRLHDYRGEDLRGQIFGPDEVLAGVDFSGADLTAVRFVDGADLRGADLSRCRLVGAGLDRADLRGVDLRGARLDQASLIAADLRGARLDGATWSRARLTGARLDSLAAIETDGRGWGHAPPGVLPQVQVEPRTTGAVDVAWHPDAELLAVARSSRVEIWDATTGAMIRTLADGHAGVRAVAWSWDGTRLVSGGGDGAMRLWDAGSGALVRAWSAPGGGVRAVGWSPDGTRLVSGDGGDGLLRVWDARSGALLQVIPGHVGGVQAVGWSPDGTRLASGGSRRGYDLVRVWDADSGELLRTMTGQTTAVLALGWSPDGTLLASGGDSLDGADAVQVWDADSGLLRRSLPGPMRTAYAVSWSLDGMRLVVGGDGDAYGARGVVQVWDVGSGKSLLTLDGIGYVRAVGWSPDGTRLVTGTGPDSYRLRGDGYVDRLSDDDPRGGGVRLWDAGSGASLLVLSGHNSGVRAVAWSPDGRRLASGGVGDDDAVRVWDVESGELSLTLSGHVGAVLAVAWSPDGTRLVSGGEPPVWHGGYGDLGEDGAVRVWDTGSGALLLNLNHDGGVRTLGWSPDGTRLAGGGGHRDVGDDEVVRVWDTGSGELVLILPGHVGGVSAVAWSPDGTRLVSGGGDGVVRVWDAGSGELLLDLPGHLGGVRTVAWSPDGMWLVSGGDDHGRGDGKVWHAGSGELLLTLDDAGEVQAVSWSTDGSAVIATDGLGVLRTWSSLPSRRLARLAEKLPRSLRRRLLRPFSTPAAVRESQFSGVVTVAPDGRTMAVACDDGSIDIEATGATDAADGREGLRLLALPDGGWASFRGGGRRYRLAGDPAGRFWWSSGLCRFEPGELDGYGVTRE